MWCENPEHNDKFMVKGFVNYSTGHYTTVALNKSSEWFQVDNLNGSVRKLNDLFNARPEVMVLNREP